MSADPPSWPPGFFDRQDPSDDADSTVAGERVLRFAPDMEDEVVAASCVVKDGVVVHEMTRAVLQGGSL